MFCYFIKDKGDVYLVYFSIFRIWFCVWYNGVFSWYLLSEWIVCFGSLEKNGGVVKGLRKVLSFKLNKGSFIRDGEWWFFKGRIFWVIVKKGNWVFICYYFICYYIYMLLFVGVGWKDKGSINRE